MIAIRKLINPTVMVGWSSTICAIVVFSGLILMVLGIIETCAIFALVFSLLAMP